MATLWHSLKQDPQQARMLLTALALGVAMALEALWPRRVAQRRRRWLVNVVLVLLAGLLLSVLPIAAIGVAAWAQAHRLGLLAILSLPPPAAIVVAVIALDAAMYWQHRCMHGPDWLWRLHRVHHSDLEFDVTTALRFHPAELLAAWTWKLAAIVLLGASPLAVLVFETLTGIYSLFIHSNLHLPERWDRRLRMLLVTPDLHRVHHSVRIDEGNRNFGTILTLWDRVFASHCGRPLDGHDGMQLGLPVFRDADAQSLPALLWQPLRGAAGPEIMPTDAAPNGGRDRGS
ncbi:sterol desaturase family protein [Solimonas terrae]|uniref:Sterol desaturase family protein n=1 Tax=Solimonas terrae TaxID=1396819 RepID=A0A6M2BVR6_9GAMM|nr:sterol desaturase family protein [Solimonas terrae]NGY06742.1 sterol desaturase family protein [Solimonas terrae]